MRRFYILINIYEIMVFWNTRFGPMTKAQYFERFGRSRYERGGNIFSDISSIEEVSANRVYKVKSQTQRITRHSTHKVELTSTWTCDCIDYNRLNRNTSTSRDCKHIKAVVLFISQEIDVQEGI